MWRSRCEVPVALTFAGGHEYVKELAIMRESRW
jgi:hypothetical protein